MTNIAVFVSGEGSNARNIVKYFHQPNSEVRIALYVSSKPDAPAVEFAQNNGIATFCPDKKSFYDTDETLSVLKQYNIDLIVLAGFLWLVPGYILRAYPERVVNIHPSLLPRHGGKGMYGKRVHEAVIAEGDKTSGITIHLADAEYDRGRILHQASCPVLPDDTPETLAQRIHELEYDCYPVTIDEYIRLLADKS